MKGFIIGLTFFVVGAVSSGLIYYDKGREAGLLEGAGTLLKPQNGQVYQGVVVGRPLVAGSWEYYYQFPVGSKPGSAYVVDDKGVFIELEIKK